MTEEQFKNVIALLKAQLDDLEIIRSKMMFSAGRAQLYEIGYAVKELEKAIEVLTAYREGYKCDIHGEFDGADILWKAVSEEEWIACCPECESKVEAFKRI